MNKSCRTVWSKAYLLVSPHMRRHPVTDQLDALYPEFIVDKVT